MKIIFNLSNSSNSIHISFTLFFVFCFGFYNTNAQSVIYKKDGTKVEVVQVDKKGKIRYYKILNDSIGIVHLISINSIDSIKFENGEVEKFFLQTDIPGAYNINGEPQNEKIKKNLIGVNIWPILYSSVEIFYERLFLNNKLGFKNYFLINTVSGFNPYGSFYRRVNYQFSSGLNYYFLQSDMFRFGTGMSFSTGQFDEENYTYNNDSNDFNFYQDKVHHTGLCLNASLSYMMLKTFHPSIELDVPLFSKASNFPVLFKSEIAIKF